MRWLVRRFSWLTVCLVATFYLTVQSPAAAAEAAGYALPIPAPTWFFYADDRPLNRPGILKTIYLWTRLQPLPRSARHLDITTNGGPFTKEYLVTFDAPASDVRAWLQASPGTRDQDPLVLADGTRKFAIAPRDAAFAELQVAADQQTVRIWTIWR